MMSRTLLFLTLFCVVPSLSSRPDSIPHAIDIGLSQADVQQPLQLAARDGNDAFSPPYYPSPWMDPQAAGWEDAYARAKAFVSQLTLVEKVNLTTGTGWFADRCVGNVGSLPRFGMRGLCMQDGPLGLRLSDYNSAFSAGVTAGATWSRRLWHERGLLMGTESKEKGVDVLLGPVAGPIGRAPEGGRNWEGFSPDPYLTGKALADVTVGIQEGGTIACAKHFIGNEQGMFCFFVLEKDVKYSFSYRTLPPGPRSHRLWIQRHRLHVVQYR